MRLWVFSDLHLEFAQVKTPLKIPDADVCVAAGDIHARGAYRSIKWLAEHVCPHMPVIFVCGNHEFYQSSIIEGIYRGAEAASAVPNLHFLENGFVEIGDVMFSGQVLWTDFELMGSVRFAMEYAEEVMNDYTQIAYTKKPFVRMRAAHSTRLHFESRRVLTSFLDQNRSRRTVVVSHHAPSRRSIAPQYASDITSAAFASDLEPLILEKGPALWVHGHVHHRFDYSIGGTRVLCNPRGYPDEGSFADFDFSLVVEV
jgi:Icc-related predicted phosphoesterase